MPAGFSVFVNWMVLVLGGAGVAVSIVLQLSRARRPLKQPAPSDAVPPHKGPPKLTLVKTNPPRDRGGEVLSARKN